MGQNPSKEMSFEEFCKETFTADFLKSAILEYNKTKNSINKPLSKTIEIKVCTVPGEEEKCPRFKLGDQWRCAFVRRYDYNYCLYSEKDEKNEV